MINEKLLYFYWLLTGRIIPASGDIKRFILKQYAIKYKLINFVETGTFHGDTVEYMRQIFKKVHSVELSKDLYKKARARFANYSNVTIWNGDSGKVLKKILPTLNKPSLFWLDAHGSGGDTAEGDEWSPIIKELKIILDSSKIKHVILIDDARGFTGHLSPTISEIEEVIVESGRNYNFEVKDDIIRIILT